MVNIDALAREPKVAAALRWVEQHAGDVVEEAIRICRIPAPTFEEAERAAYARTRFAQLGLADVGIDAAGNARGRRPGRGRGRGLAMSAHLDTVFPRDTDLTVTRAGTRLAAPGIGDNSTGLAGLLAVLEALNAAGVATDGDLHVAANTGEEGLGDLRGMKAFIGDVRDRVWASVAVEGLKQNRVIHVGVGSRRYKVKISARGGHSWGHFPSPSAVHILARAIADISRLSVPQEPKTTYNVGVVRGGTSVNTIAAEAEMLVDMRSVAPAALAELERQVVGIIERTAHEGEGQAVLELVGDRPAGSIPGDHPLVQTCRAIHRHLGLVSFSEPSSTDANVPLGLGMPGVCLSITEGANEHRLDEYLETEPMPTGLKALILTAVALTRAE